MIGPLIAVAKTSRVTVLIDSLDALVEATNCRIPQAYDMLRRLLNQLPRTSVPVLV